MRIGDRLFGPFLALLGMFVIWEAQKLPKIPGVRFGADLLPTGAGILLVVFGGLILLSGLRQPGQLLNVDDWKRRGRSGLAALWSLGGLLLGMVLFETLGFPLMGTLFMAVMMTLMGARLRVTIIVAPFFVLLLYYVFSGLLKVSLPAGMLDGIMP
ncbi:tripartite tricarboxylate transporter TctB family protein [Alloyangia pacifica]|uniref:Putative tricarboxylic transport membrane protein n=1 Tax=Alloyangia pacifica TaxID=311180 RepID=A0A1I6WJK4_9RHOB|nr:tripartite tricarboxylate transporter TctB family protein [Alloyangia pacifica]SDI82789.1 putative tricarboxylic transport membrane protein [Alloyangia pacifica]SFT26086.1 putative tricarboxylic transport membrane protein [Alloyangia pacifica]